MTDRAGIEAALRSVGCRLCGVCHYDAMGLGRAPNSTGDSHAFRPDYAVMAALVDGATAALLRELYAEMVNQFALYFTTDDVRMVSTGGLSDLEKAFEYFKLPDPCTLVHFRAALAGPQEPTA